ADLVERHAAAKAHAARAGKAATRMPPRRAGRPAVPPGCFLLRRRNMTHWADALAEQVLGGGQIDREAARRILTAADEDVPALLRATARVREHFCGRRVKLCQLRNARSGLCPEDCHYC